MGMRGVAIAVTAVALALAGCDRKPASGPSGPAPSPAAAPAAPLPPLTYRQATRDAEVALSLPAAVAAVPALYTKLYADGRNTLQAFMEGSKSELEELRANGETVRPYAASADYALSAETPRLISLIATRMENTGGAHPNTVLEALTWDKQAGRPAPAAALFRKGADLAAADKALCDAIHAAKQARAGDPALTGSRKACPELAATELALAPSTVPGKAGGVIALFSPYELGAYAEGDYRVLLPLAALQPVLSPDYAGEFAGAPPAGAATTP